MRSSANVRQAAAKLSTANIRRAGTPATTDGLRVRSLLPYPLQFPTYGAIPSARLPGWLPFGGPR
jgi:hypothetical protein